MYGQAGAGGQLGMQGGSAQGGNATDQVSLAREGMAMNLQQLQMNQAQIDLLKAQKNNVDADTQNKENGVRTGLDLENRIKKVNAEVSEATTMEQKEQAWQNYIKMNQEIEKNSIQIGTMNATQKEEIEQARLIPFTMT